MRQKIAHLDGVSSKLLVSKALLPVIRSSLEALASPWPESCVFAVADLPEQCFLQLLFVHP